MLQSLPILKRVTMTALVVNAALFAIKMWGFSMSRSVALFSDGMNSLLDIASSAAVLVSVRVARKAPDREHPFGHSRAEPIAGFVIAVIACVLAVEVLQESIIKFMFPHEHEINAWLFGILGVAIIAKLLLAWWQRRVGERERSPALVASAVDSRNDVFSSIAALVGITGAALGFQQADEIAGLIVGALILWSGITIIRENLDYLLGRSPSDELIVQVRSDVETIEGVEAIRFCRGHYVGNELHFEIIIACRGDITTQESSAVADRVRAAAERHQEVSVAFVHVDTIESPHHYPELSDWSAIARHPDSE
jgi:cation diffusion facilitator family transporter